VQTNNQQPTLQGLYADMKMYISAKAKAANTTNSAMLVRLSGLQLG
jgi:hypothetical protein